MVSLLLWRLCFSALYRALGAPYLRCWSPASPSLRPTPTRLPAWHDKHRTRFAGWAKALILFVPVFDEASSALHSIAFAVSNKLAIPIQARCSRFDASIVIVDILLVVCGHSRDLLQKPRARCARKREFHDALLLDDLLKSVSGPWQRRTPTHIQHYILKQRGPQKRGSKSASWPSASEPHMC